MSGSVLVALARMQVADFWPSLLATLAGFFGLCCLDVLWAKLGRREHQRPGPEFVVDVMYWLFGPVTRVLSRFAAVTSLVLLGPLWGKQITPEILHGFGPAARQPKALMVAELFLLSDFIAYWSHRLFHRVPWLWRIHAVHHGATEVKWWSAARLHPVNDALQYLFTVAPFVLFGFPFEALAPALPLFATWGIFLHTETDAALGPLRGILTSPRHHRWHHTLSHEGGNRNFSGMFAIWDRIFGTYYMPEDRVPERFGIDDDDMPADFLGQLAYPWRHWQRSGRL